jgi:hypothetical protein
LPDVGPGASVHVSVTRSGSSEFCTTAMNVRLCPVAVKRSPATWSRSSSGRVPKARSRSMLPMPWAFDGSVSLALAPVR